MTGAEEVDIDVEPTVLPGTRSFVADMDVASRFITERRCLMRAPLTDAVASAAGTAPVGMLMTLVDVGASDPALAACLPDWTVTQDLAIHAAGWLIEGPIVVDNQLVRVGKNSDVGVEAGIDRRQPQPGWAIAVGLSMGPGPGGDSLMQQSK